MHYIGRNSIDAATLDRFAFIFVDYDIKLETMISQFPEVVNVSKAMRKLCQQNQMRHLITPRATYAISQKLRSGYKLEDCIEEH
jgi:hypothetical protein